MAPFHLNKKGDDMNGHIIVGSFIIQYVKNGFESKVSKEKGAKHVLLSCV